jgi:hypothetical protein
MSFASLLLLAVIMPKRSWKIENNINQLIILTLSQKTASTFVSNEYLMNNRLPAC